MGELSEYYQLYHGKNPTEGGPSRTSRRSDESDEDDQGPKKYSTLKKPQVLKKDAIMKEYLNTSDYKSKQTRTQTSKSRKAVS